MYNLCDGECPPGIMQDRSRPKESDALKNNMTYIPPKVYLGDKTLSLDAKHNSTGGDPTLI